MEQDTYFILKLCSVLLDGLPPYKGVLVGFGLDLRSIDILHIKRYKAALGQQQHDLCEDVVDLFLYAVAEAVDRHKIRSFLRRQPDIMDVALHLTLYIAARIYVVHIGIEDDLEHHLRVVGTPAAFTVQFFELPQVKTLDNGINNAYRVVFRYIFIGIQQKKQPVVVTVRFCM